MKRILFAAACLLPIFIFLMVPVNSEKVILIIGDSLSYAYGIKSEDSWTHLLQERLADKMYNYKLINFSIPGDVTGKAVKRFTWAVNEYKPVITIIELGANDGLNHVSINEIKNNLLQMIVFAKRNKSRVILLGMHLPLDYNRSYRNAFSSMYPDLAKQEQITLVPHFLEKVDSNPQLMQADKLHPVKGAQAMLLETIWPALKKLL